MFMSLRAAIFVFVLLLLPLGSLQAHEAHRNNAPDPVAQTISPDQTHSEMATMPAANAADKHAGYAYSNESDKRFELVDFLGRLHPAAVHFPIALFLVAALAELIMIINPSAGVGSSVRFLVWTGAAGGVVAAILGWLAGGFRMSDRSEILSLHRWTGTGIAIAGLALALLSGATAGSKKRSVFRVVLLGVAIAIFFQGYWGAEMSLGPNHMGM